MDAPISSIECLHDRARLVRFLSADPVLHAYELGDIAPFFWPRTTWYGWSEGGELRALLLLYSGAAVPSVLCFSADLAPARRLLRAARPMLPRQMHVQLSEGLLDLLTDEWRVLDHQPRLRMALRDPGRLDAVDTSAVERLGVGDLDEVRALYARAYPGNWFVPEMLQTGYYFGVRDQGRLRAIAGVHVVSAPTRVAALGNIATEAGWRGRGFARAATARLCQELLGEVDHIALNVGVSNLTAQAVCRRLGFQAVARHDEVMLGAG